MIIKNKEKYFQISIVLIAILMAVINVWPAYKDFILNNNIQYLKIILVLSLGLFGLYSLKLAKIFSLRAILIAAFILESVFIGYFTSFRGLLVSIVSLFFLLCLGIIINKKNSIFSNFVVGYGILANILHIPFLNNSIPLDKFYGVILLFIIITIIYKSKYLFKYFVEKINQNDEDIKYRHILFFSILYLSASITGFMWDDINSYLYFPLKSILNNYSVLSYSYPSSLVFQNLHGLAYASFMGSIIGSIDYEIVYAFKTFNALCFLLLFFCLIGITKKISTVNSINNLIYFTICTSSIWFVEITSNYTDFSVLLISIYVVSLLIEFREFKNIKIELKDYLIFSLFVAISFKSLVAVLPIVVIDQLNNEKNFWKRVSNLSVLPLFSLGIFIRNYFYSGNPTFPAGNHFWKSTHFFTDSSNIVANKFVPAWGRDFSLLANFLSNSDKSVAIFYTAVNTFYSPIFFALVTIAFLNFIFRNKPVASNIFLLLGFLAFCFTILLPGAQYKYFIPSFIYFCIGLYILNIKYLVVFNSSNKLFSSTLNILFLLMIFTFPYSPYSGVPLQVIDNRIFSGNFRNWHEKIYFYNKVNDFIGDNKSKILLFYLQDKIFLPSHNIYEYDWYDYPVMKELADVINSTSNPFEKSVAATKFLCQNDFRYVILSAEFINNNFMNSLIPGVKGDQQSLYEINCK